MLSSPRILVVTADDLGYCTERDDAIIEAFQHGFITQTSLLVNGRSSATAAQRASTCRRETSLLAPRSFVAYHRAHNHTLHQTLCNNSSNNTQTSPSSLYQTHTSLPLQYSLHDGLPLGLHLNFTEGVYTHSPHESMMGKHEFWEHMMHVEERHRQRQCDGESEDSDEYAALRSKLHCELVSQLDLFYEQVGYHPTYLDGHNHVHVIPMISKLLMEVLPRYRIFTIRCPDQLQFYEHIRDKQHHDATREANDGREQTYEFLSPFLNRVITLAKACRVEWRAHGFQTSSYFMGLSMMGADNTLDKMMVYFDNLRQGVTEYMCHPGYPSIEGDDFSRSDERRHELSLLLNRQLCEAALSKNIEFRCSRELEEEHNGGVQTSS